MWGPEIAGYLIPVSVLALLGWLVCQEYSASCGRTTARKKILF